VLIGFGAFSSPCNPVVKWSSVKSWPNGSRLARSDSETLSRGKLGLVFWEQDQHLRSTALSSPWKIRAVGRAHLGKTRREGSHFSWSPRGQWAGGTSDFRLVDRFQNFPLPAMTYRENFDTSSSAATTCSTMSENSADIAAPRRTEPTTAVRNPKLKKPCARKRKSASRQSPNSRIL